MSNSAWFRFATSEGTVLGEVVVPTRAPIWFLPHLASMKANMGREPTMADVEAEEWLECCYSSRRPIKLLRPLAPQQQEELVFFRPGALNKMQLALQRHDKDQEGADEKARIPAAALLNDTSFLKRFCVLMDDLGRLSPEERASLRPIPRSKIQPGYQGRTFIVYQPLISSDGNPAEDRESMRLGWDRVNHFVTIKADGGFLRQVEQAYLDEVSTLITGPGSVPGPRPVPVSPPWPPTPADPRAEA